MRGCESRGEKQRSGGVIGAVGRFVRSRLAMLAMAAGIAIVGGCSNSELEDGNEEDGYSAGVDPVGDAGGIGGEPEGEASADPEYFCKAESTGLICDNVPEVEACVSYVCQALNDIKGVCVPMPDEKGAECDDGDECTNFDDCDGLGNCNGKPISSLGAGCNDNNPCTVDESCDKGACVGFPADKGTKCSDGDHCTVEDECVSGYCYGEPKDCPQDGKQCTFEMCNPGNGICEITVAEGAACEDGLACTSGKCDGDGYCNTVFEGSGGNLCDDNNECTKDICIPGDGVTPGGCENIPVQAGVGCDDGLPCTDGDSCNGEGECVAPWSDISNIQTVTGADVANFLGPGFKECFTLQASGKYGCVLVTLEGQPCSNITSECHFPSPTTDYVSCLDLNGFFQSSAESGVCTEFDGKAGCFPAEGFCGVDGSEALYNKAGQKFCGEGYGACYLGGAMVPCK